jgi:hypothetical protein
MPNPDTHTMLQCLDECLACAAAHDPDLTARGRTRCQTRLTPLPCCGCGWSGTLRRCTDGGERVTRPPADGLSGERPTASYRQCYGPP